MSVEQIIRELPPEFVRKMRNWANSDGDGGMYAMSSMFDDRIGGNDAYDSHMPILNGEAEDVDVCLRQLKLRFREPVRKFWKYEGRSMVWLGKMTGVSDKTARVRLDQGHILLQCALHKRAAAIAEFEARARQAQLERTVPRHAGFTQL